MKCTQTTLIRALDIVKHATTTKTSIPVLAHVTLEVANGRIELTANDLERELYAKFPAEGKLAKCAVPLAAFSALVKATRGAGEIEIDATRNASKLVIAANGRTFEIETMRVDDRPKPKPEPEEEPAVASFDTATFRRALDYLAPAISQDASRFHLCGLWMHGDRFAATNGHVMFMATGVGGFRRGDEEPECIARSVPAMQKICKVVDSPWIMARLWPGKLLEVHFPGAPLEVLLREKPIDAQFPPVDQVIPRHSHRFRVGRRDFLNSVATAVKVNKAHKVDKGLKLDVVGAKLRVTTPSFAEVLAISAGDSLADAKKVTKKAAVTVYVLPDYASLAAADGGDELIVEYKPGDEEDLSPLAFRPDPNLLAVVMPRKAD